MFFFVISGFLIYTIISKEIEHGNFSVRIFWERRARRLLPAAIFLMLFVSIVVLATRPPDATRYFGESISHAALLLSDLFYYNESNYFGKDATQQPLLHFWSLSVEAKFYIISPFLLLVTSEKCKSTQVAIFSTITLTSLYFCLYYSKWDSSAAFYLAPLRGWEFLSGILLAIAIENGFFGKAATWVKDIFLASAVLGVAALSILLPISAPHPSGGAIATTLLTMVAIAAGARNIDQESLLWRVYTHPAIISVGLISYSLYLWHWPILVFTRDFANTPLSGLTLTLALSGSVVMAMISFRLIETPFRHRKPQSPPEVANLPTFSLLWSWRAPLLVLSIALIGGGLLQTSGGWPGRFSDKTLAIVDDSRTQRGVVYLKCPPTGEDAPGARPPVGTFCRLGVPDSQISLAIWGDSHGDALSPAVDQFLRQSEQAGVVSVLGGCAPFTGFPYDAREDRASCRLLNSTMPAYLAALKVETVLFVANWDAWRGNQRLEAFAALDRSIASLPPSVRQIVLVTPIPLLDYNASSRMFLGSLLGLPPPSRMPISEYQKRLGDVSDRFEQLASEDPRVRILRQHSAICDDTGCASYEVDDGLGSYLPLYADKSHLNAATARYLVPLVRSALTPEVED